ncbi:MAG: HAMP domain-containing histidine kinase [Elusimicrobia bacterium]|nr:HAMP domain-containing histidine kinase [Elusimicrobiota bacterium]
MVSFRDRLVYLLAASPFVFRFFETGRWPAGARSLVVHAALGGLIFLVIRLMRQARARAGVIDGFRKTMNEAIVHDLKNPMTSVMGCLSCVLNDSVLTAQQRKLLQLALHSCRAQMVLLETLVDTSRMEQGEMTARRDRLLVRELLDDILDDTRGAAEHLGISLQESISPDLPAEMMADEGLLHRVLCNLIQNALKYTHSGGSVSLEVGVEGGSLRFAVKDTGIGIPAKYLEKLFGKYYRVEGGDQSMRRGSGLGLYFCRLAVEAHGGRIQVVSEEGKGTKISFDIPGVFIKEKES